MGWYLDDALEWMRTRGTNHQEKLLTKLDIHPHARPQRKHICVRNPVFLLAPNRRLPSCRFTEKHQNGSRAMISQHHIRSAQRRCLPPDRGRIVKEEQPWPRYEVPAQTVRTRRVSKWQEESGVKDRTVSPKTKKELSNAAEVPTTLQTTGKSKPGPVNSFMVSASFVRSQHGKEKAE